MVATVTEAYVEKRLGAIGSEDENKVVAVLEILIDSRFISNSTP